MKIDMTDSKTKPVFRYRLGIMCMLVLLLSASCTEKYLNSFNENVVSNALLTVPLRWPDAATDTVTLAPLGMKYVLLPEAASTTSFGISTFYGSYARFKGIIPMGNYNFLGYTAGQKGLMVTNELNYDNASVYAVTVSSPVSESAGVTADDVLLASCTPFFSCAATGLKVPGNEVVVADSASCKLLTSKVHVTIKNNTTYELDSITGVFRGLVLGRRLSDGSVVNPASHGAVKFCALSDETRAGSTTYSSDIRLLGIADPLDATYPYMNILNLTAWMKTGEYAFIKEDISARLSEALAGLDIDLNSLIGLEISIDAISPTGDMQVGVTVKAWEDGGDIWDDI